MRRFLYKEDLGVRNGMQFLNTQASVILIANGDGLFDGL